MFGVLIGLSALGVLGVLVNQAGLGTPVARPAIDTASALPAADTAAPDTAPAPPAFTESDLRMLEPAAMLGRLTPDQIQELRDALEVETNDVMRDRVSRILMVHHWSSGDYGSWEILTQRHLNDIDASDPDVSYKLSLHLSRKGPDRAREVIKWAEVALEHHAAWSGSTKSSRVYNLHKLRAAAAQQLWQQAEKHKTEDIATTRHLTKMMAIEWHEHIKKSGGEKGLEKSKALCLSAAGSESACSGAGQ